MFKTANSRLGNRKKKSVFYSSEVPFARVKEMATLEEAGVKRQSKLRTNCFT